MKAKPTKGEGERFLDCPHYEDCLDLAALKNWKAFTCEPCPIYTHRAGEMHVATQEEKENTRICRECGKNPTIQPTSPLCASCIGKHAWKNQGPSKPKKKKTTHHKAKPEKPQQRPDTALTIGFRKHVSIPPEDLKKLCDDHWEYVKGILTVGQLKQPSDGIEIIEYHYKTAMAHGFKHGVQWILGKAYK